MSCKRNLKLFWLLGLVLLLIGCDDGRISGTLIFEGTHQFDSETVLPGDVLLHAGTAEFAAGSQVVGSIYVVGGDLRLNGSVGGDLVLLDGQVTLYPESIVMGDLRLGGTGTIERTETAVVHGATIRGLALPQTRPDEAGWDDAARWLVGALLLASLGGLSANRRPEPLRHISMAALGHWPAAGALGLLSLLVLPIFLVMMAFTIVLLPLVVLLILAIFLVLVMGIISLGMEIGQWLWAWRQRPFAPGWATFAGTLLLLGIFQLPWLGDVLFGVTAVLLFGAVLLSRFGTKRFQPPAHLTESADRSLYQRVR